MLLRLARFFSSMLSQFLKKLVVLQQGKKVPADLDDFDLEDEEEYLTEDEETEEKNE